MIKKIEIRGLKIPLFSLHFWDEKSHVLPALQRKSTTFYDKFCLGLGPHKEGKTTEHSIEDEF